MAKYKLPRLVSPVGTFSWVYVDKPDENMDGKYKITLALDADDKATEEFISKFKAMGLKAAKEMEVVLKKTHKLPFQDGNEILNKNGEPVEAYVDKTVLVARSQFQPKAWDTAKKALPPGVFIAPGDRGRILTEVFPYGGLGSGLSARLAGVQLVEKRAGGEDFSEYFDDIDGFVAQTPEADSDADDSDDF